VATERKRQDASRHAPLVVNVDHTVPLAIANRVAAAFRPVADLFAEAERQRVPGADELRKLSAAGQAALKRRQSADADRTPAARLAPPA
jgi:hypothetical protein